MRTFRTAISLLCVFLLAIAPLSAQTAGAIEAQRQNFLSRISGPYRPKTVAPVNLSRPWIS